MQKACAFLLMVVVVIIIMYYYIAADFFGGFSFFQFLTTVWFSGKKLNRHDIKNPHRKFHTESNERKKIVQRSEWLVVTCSHL